jgi:riboflavin synthase
LFLPLTEINKQKLTTNIKVEEEEDDDDDELNAIHQHRVRACVCSLHSFSSHFFSSHLLRRATVTNSLFFFFFFSISFEIRIRILQ